MPATAANIHELRTGIGFNKQAALDTPLLAASIWSLRQTSRQIAVPQLVYENDEEEFGKGDYWATQQFPMGLDLNWPLEGYLTSEKAAMLGAFGLGKVTKAAAGTGFKYTCVPLVDAVDGIDMPPTTLVQQIRTSTDALVDVAFPGVCCEEFSISLKTGIGRQNATMRSVWAGIGKYVSPSTIVIPAAYTEHSLNAMSATSLAIAGTDYIATKRFLSLDMAWKNNIRLDTGYFPGSGSQTESGKEWGYRGRMRRGKPSVTLTFAAEFIKDSTELATLKAGTEGTAVFEIVGATIGAGPDKHAVKVTFHRVAFKAVPIEDADGIVSCRVECTVMKHATNGVLTLEATCEQDTIGAEAA